METVEDVKVLLLVSLTTKIEITQPKRARAQLRRNSALTPTNAETMPATAGPTNVPRSLNSL
jgi:hypothetical protein